MATSILSPRLLAEGWRKCYSVKAERPYYFNVQTNASVWSPPTLSGDVDERSAAVPGCKSPDLPEPAQEVPGTPILISSQSDQSQSSQASSFQLVPQPVKSEVGTQTGEREFRFCLRDTDTAARLVSVTEYKGRYYVGIREFFKNSATGQLFPTKKGINLNLDEWSRLKCIMQRVDEAVKTLTCS